MKIKKQITAVILLVCILLTPVLTSSASAHAYDHVYTDVTVITPDSLEDVFGEAEVDRAAYTYEMVELNNSRAVVALEMELKIGHDYYTAVVSGTIDVHSLPSGDILYEGPIDGNMMVGENEHRVTISFIKTNTSKSAFISVTIQNDSNTVILMIGEVITQGEIFDFFVNRSENNSHDNSYGLNVDDEIAENVNLKDLDDSSGQNNTYSFSPGFSPITHPGGDNIESLGGQGQYILQSTQYSWFEETNRVALETKVYFYKAFGTMAVTFKPFSNNAQAEGNEKYLQPPTTFYSVSTSLRSFDISLDLTGTAPEQHAQISGIVVPDLSIMQNSSIGARYFSAFVIDLFDYADIPTELLSTAIDDVRGNINFIGLENPYSKKIDVDMSLRAAVLDEISCGVPFYFTLIRPYPETYVGNTTYKVTVNAKYEYIAHYYSDSPISFCVFHTTHQNVHESSLNLNPT